MTVDHPGSSKNSYSIEVIQFRGNAKAWPGRVYRTDFARTAGFAVSLLGAGTKTTGVIRCDQPRALDLASRSAHKLEDVPEAIMDEVLARLATIFE